MQKYPVFNIFPVRICTMQAMTIPCKHIKSSSTFLYLSVCRTRIFTVPLNSYSPVPWFAKRKIAERICNPNVAIRRIGQLPAIKYQDNYVTTYILVIYCKRISFWFTWHGSTVCSKIADKSLPHFSPHDVSSWLLNWF